MVDPTQYSPPIFFEKRFTCPHCGAFASQTFSFQSQPRDVKGDEIYASHGACCGQICIWFRKELVVPAILGGPVAHRDLPAVIAADYHEAREIFGKSPRGAAALLRLTLQKLCQFLLGDASKTLNDDIALLVQHGLPSGTQKALDIVRVIGNEAVHPGVIDLDDTPQIVQRLFHLVNFITEKTITEPRELNELYAVLPNTKRQQIDKRDQKALAAPAVSAAVVLVASPQSDTDAG